MKKVAGFCIADREKQGTEDDRYSKESPVPVIPVDQIGNWDTFRGEQKDKKSEPLRQAKHEARRSGGREGLESAAINLPRVLSYVAGRGKTSAYHAKSFHAPGADEPSARLDMFQRRAARFKSRQDRLALSAAANQ
jgi:hypothetical protein